MALVEDQGVVAIRMAWWVGRFGDVITYVIVSISIKLHPSHAPVDGGFLIGLIRQHKHISAPVQVQVELNGIGSVQRISRVG